MVSTSGQPDSQYPPCNFISALEKRPLVSLTLYFSLCCHAITSVTSDDHEKATVGSATSSLGSPCMSHCSPRGGTVLVSRVSILDILTAHSESLIKKQFKKIEAGRSLKLQSSFCCCRDTFCLEWEAKVGLPLTSGLSPPGLLSDCWRFGPHYFWTREQAVPTLYCTPTWRSWLMSYLKMSPLPREGESTIIPSLQDKGSYGQQVNQKIVWILIHFLKSGFF